MTGLGEGVRRQFTPVFANIDRLFDALDEDRFEDELGGFPVWRQMYHLVHSLDKNLIDPGAFTEPALQTKNLDVLGTGEGGPLPLEAVLAYYREVRDRIEAYLAGLDDTGLAEPVSFPAGTFSRLELILAQLRHAMYHVGYLHCALKLDRGRTPEYVGLYRRIPDA